MEKYLRNKKNNTQIKLEIYETDIEYLSSMGVKVSVIADSTNKSRFLQWVDITSEVSDLFYFEMNKILKSTNFASIRALHEEMLEVSADIVLDEIEAGNIKDLLSSWSWQKG